MSNCDTMDNENNMSMGEFINTEQSFTRLDISKSNLFFRSTPNKIAFDKFTVRNTGTTCVYLKWKKKIKPFNIQDKKSDGIDRFFCHYVNFINIG
jgi:hypothetical protein